ncbi:hypothetical protein LguiB_022301 [Lonicera macranthoides]
MADTLVAVNDDDVDIIGNNDDLSSWEIINPSDDDSTYSFDSSTSDNENDDVVDDHQIVDLESKGIDSFGSPSLVLDPCEPVPVVAVVVESISNDYYEEEYEDEDGDGDDEEEEEEECDLDDELVPKWVNDRFGRQRMRKFGKKAYPKINKSKKSAYYYHRPGLLHGKHGLGLKHSLI